MNENNFVEEWISKPVNFFWTLGTKYLHSHIIKMATPLLAKLCGKVANNQIIMCYVLS